MEIKWVVCEFSIACYFFRLHPGDVADCLSSSMQLRRHLTWGEHLICNTILAVLALWAIRLERLNKEQELMIKTNDFEQDIFVR